MSLRVVFFGAWDPGYPRNRILRAGLAAAGVQVIEARVRARRAVFRFPELVVRHARAVREADIVFVPEFRHKDVPIARLLAGRKPVVFDPLVSRWDTLVRDWGLHAERSAQARWNRGLDRFALRHADLVLCDTWEHGALFERLGAPRERLHRVLVGAERDFFDVGPPDEDGPVTILYVGGFLPLHGVRHVIEAAEIMERAADLPEFRFRLIGRGIDFDAVGKQVASLGLKRVVLEGPHPYSEAPPAFARANIVLGAFGTTEKAGRVIPHKVYQGVAAGRAVVTGDSPAVREVFTPGIHLWTVPHGDAEALAESLMRLVRDRALRAQTGARARARALEVATPERIGADLAAALEALRSKPVGR